MKAIVAVDNNWAIGYKNDLLASIPADKKFFRNETKGKVIIMGRKTLESFPAGQPLENRVNVVLTGNKDYNPKGTVTVRSIEEALKVAENYDTNDVYLIGGGSVYSQMLKYCDTALVTKIDYKYQADTYFPNLDEDPEWEMTDESDEQTCYDMVYTFCTYERKKH
ncbi:MAG: dihydrofolate reductase [Lachnospiraceae bacterium]|nr:dihydrofolate reductase [Lachnospiraceae bacterium]